MGEHYTTQEIVYLTLLHKGKKVPNTINAKYPFMAFLHSSSHADITIKFC